jgi:hypothetical protein
MTKTEAKPATRVGKLELRVPQDRRLFRPRRPNRKAGPASSQTGAVARAPYMRILHRRFERFQWLAATFPSDSTFPLSTIIYF